MGVRAAVRRTAPGTVHLALAAVLIVGCGTPPPPPEPDPFIVELEPGNVVEDPQTGLSVVGIPEEPASSDPVPLGYMITPEVAAEAGRILQEDMERRKALEGMEELSRRDPQQAIKEFADQAAEMARKAQEDERIFNSFVARGVVQEGAFGPSLYRLHQGSLVQASKSLPASPGDAQRHLQQALRRLATQVSVRSRIAAALKQRPRRATRRPGWNPDPAGAPAFERPEIEAIVPTGPAGSTAPTQPTSPCPK